jgi:hypothetical protein
MKSLLFVLGTFLSFTTLDACATMFPTEQGTVRVRAANDFSCSEDQVTVDDIGGHAYRASGCGQRGEYACASRVGGAGTGLVSDITCRREVGR